VRLDPEYASGHLEHAYALTGHGMQGGTVEWAVVIGQPRDFTRNWSYTALSRAREPTEILLVDELNEVWLEREEIAPVGPSRGRDPLARMELRMRERDDEDLAIEQLHDADLVEHAHEPRDHVPAHAAAIDPTDRLVDRPWVSPLRRELRQLEDQVHEIAHALRALPVADARQILQLRDSIAHIEAAGRGAAQRPTRWRERQMRKVDEERRAKQLVELRRNERELLDRVPNPEDVLQHAERLHYQRRELSARRRDVREQAVAAELATDPPWLTQTLGPEPEVGRHRDRWQRTAREVASHRISEDITDPFQNGVGEKDLSLLRSISDTRRAVGLDPPDLSPGYDAGS
jgi:hypothetical protein